MYGYTSWGLTNPAYDVECGASGDLNFFTNVAALASFLQPYLVPAAPTPPAPASTQLRAPAPVAGRR